MAIYLVNQGETYQFERAGNYIWSPKLNKNGYHNSGYNRMESVKKGDFIIHNSGGKISAISIAQEDCSPRTQPKELKEGQNTYDWDDDGWGVNTKYYDFDVPLSTSSMIEWAIKNYTENSAFQKNGKLKQQYLCDLSKAHAEYLLNTAIINQKNPEVLQVLKLALYQVEQYVEQAEMAIKYNKKPPHKKTDDIIEEIKSEVDDDYSDDSLFNISSWGADLSFREIITMYEEDELVKPELQRKYVWDKVEASRFIESILMGLPVPSIFLAKSGSQKLIVDGYQRIMTVNDYVRGIFSGDGKLFRLSNSEKINARWRNKAFQELSTDEQRKIRSTTIHAIIFEQKYPENNDTSLYQVFERINTSGRTLTPQEIRNCVYQGSLNSLLFELNENKTWRILFGTEIADNRMRDLEYILRFFVMCSSNVRNSSAKQISLKKALNQYMGQYVSADEKTIADFRNMFLNTMDNIYSNLGENAFRNYSRGRFTKKFHPAIFDAISVAFYQAQKNGVNIKAINESTHVELLCNDDFKKAISIRTTDVMNIRKRIEMVEEHLIREDKNES